MMNKSTMIFLAVCAVLAVAVSPWLALGVMFIAIVCGSLTVYAMVNLVNSYLPRGVDMASEIAQTVVASLLADNNDRQTSGHRLPVFIPVRGVGRADFLDRLYAAPQFKTLCQAITLMGPVPCMPALAYLQRQAR